MAGLAPALPWPSALTAAARSCLMSWLERSSIGALWKTLGQMAWNMSRKVSWATMACRRAPGWSATSSRLSTNEMEVARGAKCRW